MIDAKTEVCAVIGDPIEHSLSPAIHNAAFAEKGLNRVYVAFQVKDVERAIAGVRGLRLGGLSVTIPHKTSVIRHLDALDPTAENIGAVNTVVVESDGRLVGYNTDGTGALKALQSAGAPLEGADVLLVGSGGAARGIAFTLATQARLSSLTITGVVESQLIQLVSELKAKTRLPVERLPANQETYEERIPQTQILINASPIGMSPRIDETPVPPQLLPPGLTVFDIVYNPLKTRLLSEAEIKGCRTVAGVEMFVWQAVTQFELWTREEAPVEVMRQVVLDALNKGN